jgi:NitT/TauT family transport system substrate-binding protein
MKRTEFIAAGSLALLAASKAASGEEAAKLRVAVTPDQDSVGVLYAQQAGLFRKAGIDLDVARMNGSPEITAALVGGSLDVGKVSTYNVILAHAKGIPLLVEAPAALYTAGVGDIALVVAKNSPITKPADLNGKTVATNSIGDYLSIAIMGWVDGAGGDSKTLRFIEVPRAATSAAIVAGRVDAGILAQPNLNAAIASGSCKTIGYPLDVFGKQYVATVYVTAPAFAAANGAVLARFRRALSEGSADADAHQDQALSLLVNFTGLDRAQLAAMTKIVVGTQRVLRDPSMFQPIIDAAQKYKTITRRFPYTELIDPNALTR